MLLGMAKKEKNLGGRPATVHADKMVAMRFDAETIAALDRLAAAWNVSKNEATRRAIRHCAPK
jgi:hypothetical protein